MSGQAKKHPDVPIVIGTGKIVFGSNEVVEVANCQTLACALGVRVHILIQLLLAVGHFYNLIFL